MLVFLMAAGLFSAISLAAELRPTVGFAVSDSRFAAGGSEVTGHVTIFDGESVTSGHLPTRLNLQDGWRFLIGVGSRVQVSRTALQLDGGSLEIVAVGQTERPLHVAGLRVIPLDRDTKAALYISRADLFAVSVESGAIAVRRPNGEEIRKVETGSMATFANTRDEIRVSETDAALEISAVQAAELEHLGKLGALNPAIGEKAEVLLGALAAASAGLIGGGGGIPRGGMIPGGQMIPGGGRIPGGEFPASGLSSEPLAESVAGGEVPPIGSQPMVATDEMNFRSFVSRRTSGLTPEQRRRIRARLSRLRNETRAVQNQVATTVWRGTRCGTNCRFGIPIVTTHIFFFPVVGGIIRPFCIQPSCNTPPPFRN